jgi:protein gp37
MGEQTKIEWADKTFNPWEGCQKVGPGCDNCYAESRNARFSGGTAINWGAGAPRRRTSEANWKQPVKWNKEAEAKGVRYRVFCSSLADVFDNAVDPGWRTDLFDLIANTQNLDWLLLTKRISNAEDMINASLLDDGPTWPWENVWIGATIINQSEADRDIPKLLAIKAFKRFLSVEPMLGEIVLTSEGFIAPDEEGPARVGYMVGPDDKKSGLYPERWQALFKSGIDWVICGGESGPKARPMHPDWVRSLRDQCEAAAVPFLFKQWGEWLPARKEGDNFEFVDQSFKAHFGWVKAKAMNLDSDYISFRLGKTNAGRMLDGKESTEFPNIKNESYA